MTDDFDRDRFDDIILALLWLNSFREPGGHRAWKSLDWDALDRLHERGLISNPRRRARSVSLSDEAVDSGHRLFRQFFGDPAPEEPAAGQARRKPRKPAAELPEVRQFKITLSGVRPPIWRRIQLAGNASFWDLHCAINDAMGWDDIHLHAFHFEEQGRHVQIGIPMDDLDMGDTPVRADWDVPVAEFFDAPGSQGDYVYDFGDDWRHRVVLEAVVPREAGTRYPRCIDGARACPPEDCGGLPGYQRLCAVLADPTNADDEGEQFLEWLGEDFDPDAFDPAGVRFDSAKRRLKDLLRNDPGFR